MGKTVKVVLVSKKRRKDGGKGAKKYGRHLAHCAQYRNSGRREKNKARVARKIQKMLAKKAKRKGA